LPHWNQTFTVLPAGSSDAHRPLRAEHELAAILSLVEERIVTSDYTIRYQGKIYQIARGDIRPGLRGGRVRVEQRLDGNMAVKFRQYGLSVRSAWLNRKRPHSGNRQARRGLAQGCAQLDEDFHLRKSPPLGVISAGATRGGSPTFFGG